MRRLVGIEIALLIFHEVYLSQGSHIGGYMKSVRLFLSAVLTLGTLSASASNSLGLRYHCKSNKPVTFASGDKTFRSQRATEIEWSPRDTQNLNLVIGEGMGLIWVRQPYKTTERLLTIFRHVPAVGYVQDSTDVQMGQLGESTSESVTFDFEDPITGANHVECRVGMGSSSL